MSQADHPEQEEANDAIVEDAEQVALPPLEEPLPAEELANLLEALVLASDQPLSLDRMLGVFENPADVSKAQLREALKVLDSRYSGTALEINEVASGWRIQTRQRYAPWIARLWKEKPPKFSRAMLETLALVCYRQPITRGEIEEVRGVSVSSNIIRTLTERGWINEVGVREVPGRPVLFGTTRQFLDDLGLKSLDQLPSLPEIKDLDALDAALQALIGEQTTDADNAEETNNEETSSQSMGGGESEAQGAPAREEEAPSQADSPNSEESKSTD